MTKHLQLAALAVAVFVAGAAYVAGRVEGAAGERAAQHAEQLAANTHQLEQLAPKLERAAAVKITRQAKADTARAEYSSARSQLELVDSTHARVAGELLELPAPVIQTVQRADVAIVRDSLAIVSANAWGELWKAKAELLELRVGILEEQLEDERKSGRRARIRDVVTAGAIGGILGIIVAH